MKEIVQQGNPVLRKVAKYIDPKDITTPEIQSVLTDMHAALTAQKDGVAIAAPQIGESLQIFVVADIFKNSQERNLVYINPEIIESSEETKWLNEGCLSCRWKLGEVKRSLHVSIRAYDDQGRRFEESADKFLAHIFQHETDHLHGVLFVDKARDLRDMSEDEILEAQGK